MKRKRKFRFYQIKFKKLPRPAQIVDTKTWIMYVLTPTNTYLKFPKTKTDIAKMFKSRLRDQVFCRDIYKMKPISDEKAFLLLL